MPAIIKLIKAVIGHVIIDGLGAFVVGGFKAAASKQIPRKMVKLFGHIVKRIIKK